MRLIPSLIGERDDVITQIGELNRYRRASGKKTIANHVVCKYHAAKLIARLSTGMYRHCDAAQSRLNAGD
jgi:hypothetical protein